MDVERLGFEDTKSHASICPLSLCFDAIPSSRRAWRIRDRLPHLQTLISSIPSCPTSIAALPLCHHVPPPYIYTLRYDGSRPPYAHRLAVTQWKHRIASTYRIKRKLRRCDIHVKRQQSKTCMQLRHCLIDRLTHHRGWWEASYLLVGAPRNL